MSRTSDPHAAIFVRSGPGHEQTGTTSARWPSWKTRSGSELRLFGTEFRSQTSIVGPMLVCPAGAPPWRQHAVRLCGHDNERPQAGVTARQGTESTPTTSGPVNEQRKVTLPAVSCTREAPARHVRVAEAHRAGPRYFFCPACIFCLTAFVEAGRFGFGHPRDLPRLQSWSPSGSHPPAAA